MKADRVERVGVVLLHFLWEGVALALLLWVILAFTRDANARYGAACGILLLMALCPVFTFWHIWSGCGLREC